MSRILLKNGLTAEHHIKKKKA